VERLRHVAGVPHERGLRLGVFLLYGDDGTHFDAAEGWRHRPDRALTPQPCKDAAQYHQVGGAGCRVGHGEHAEGVTGWLRLHK